MNDFRYFSKHLNLITILSNFIGYTQLICYVSLQNSEVKRPDCIMVGDHLRIPRSEAQRIIKPYNNDT